MSVNSGLWKTNQEWAESIDASPISEKSKASYKKQLRSAVRIFGIDGATSLSTLMSKPELIESVMKGGHVNNSVRSYLGAVVSLFKRGEESHFFKRSDPQIAELQSKWVNALQGTSKKYNERIDRNEESEKERESRTTLTEWHEALDREMKDDPLSLETLLIAFHALVHPPLRGGDLSRVHIGFTESGNCIYRNPQNDHESILLIRDHKTSKHYGTLERVLRGEIVKILRENVNENLPRDWLFVTQSGAPYSSDGFARWKASVFHDVFGRNVTTNSLRHAYISQMDRQNQTVQEARDVAHAMGHNLQMQRQYVRFQR
jgi:hypothetical protein